jgi:uncharacterized protein YecE (DUF72 family)
MSEKIQWRIGCSGFHYREWKEVFYPKGLPQRLWFEYYTQHFNTLELNVSFYQFPKLAGLQKWFNSSPDDFLFSLKVPRIITHYKKFVSTEQLITDFYAVIEEGLGKKLGAILFQLPPQLQYSPQLLDTLVRSVKPGYNNVFEFRHPSWWTTGVYDLLSQHDISFSGSSHPRLPDEPIINRSLFYYRFHGVPVLFKSMYSEAFIKEKADTVLSNPLVKTAYCYFNNTAGPAALANAQWLQQYTGSWPVVKPG